MSLPIAEQIAARTFPPFSLERLLKTTFAPKAGQRLCVLIDLENPSDIKDFAFLKNPSLTIQKHAVESFQKPLNDGILAKMGLKGGEIFAYKLTGGSNLDLPDEAFDPEGKQSARFSRFLIYSSARDYTIPPRGLSHSARFRLFPLRCPDQEKHLC